MDNGERKKGEHTHLLNEKKRGKRDHMLVNDIMKNK